MHIILDDDGDYWFEQPDGRFKCQAMSDDFLLTQAEIHRIYGTDKIFEERT